MKKLGNWLGIDINYFFKNSFWVTLKNGVGMVSGFLLSIAFARLVSKEAYGQYTFILSSIFLVGFVSFPKFSVALSQSVAKGFDYALLQATKVSILGSLVGSVILALVAVRYLFLGDPILGYGFVVAAGFFPLYMGLKTYDYFLVGKKKFNLSAIYGAIGSIATTSALIAMMFKGANPVGLIFAYLLVNGGLYIIYFIKTEKLVGNRRRDPEVVRYGVYLSILAVTAGVVSKLGAVMLNHFKGAEVLAIYSIAIIIPKAVQNLMQNFIDVAKFKVADRNRKDLLRVVTTHWLKWVGLGVAVAAGLWVLLPIAIPLIYSNKYNDAIRFSQVASLSLIFFPINTFLGEMVLLEKKRKIIALSHFIPSVPNIILIPLAISWWGIWGVIGVNLASWVYMTPFNLWAFFRKDDL